MTTPESATKVATNLHQSAYPGISPTRPELSQKGRVVVVTGGSAGIGLGIAEAFAQAEAAIIILTARREKLLTEAASTLQAKYPGTRLIGHRLDISDTADIERFWAYLEAENLVVDVLVLNAARFEPLLTSMINSTYDALRSDLLTNVGGNMSMIISFYRQKNRETSRKLVGNVRPSICAAINLSGLQALVNVSTTAIHDFDIAAQMPTYSISKCACTLMTQLFAKSVSADDMQIVSYHPGCVFTQQALNLGLTPSSLPWDDVTLPGCYAVWAASDEAKFLHGRFTWAAWDVDELQTGKTMERINNDSAFLKVGVVGL